MLAQLMLDVQRLFNFFRLETRVDEARLRKTRACTDVPCDACALSCQYTYESHAIARPSAAAPSHQLPKGVLLKAVVLVIVMVMLVVSVLVVVVGWRMGHGGWRWGGVGKAYFVCKFLVCVCEDVGRHCA